MPKKHVQLCVGFDERGRYFNCGRVAGTPWSDTLCDECDKRRIARVTAQLENIANGGPGGDVVDADGARDA